MSGYREVLLLIQAFNAADKKENRPRNSAFAFVQSNGEGFQPNHLRRCPKKALGRLAERLGSHEEAARRILLGEFVLSKFHLFVKKDVGSL